MRVATAVFLIAAFIYNTDGRKEREDRIVAGREADISEFPYQVSIQMYGQHVCGGSIVHDLLILSVGHCAVYVKDLPYISKSAMAVRVGSTLSEQGGQLFGIRRVLIHEQYNDDATVDRDDIALILLQKRVTFGPQVQPIRLATKSPTPGMVGWVTGYGVQHVVPSRRSENVKLLMAVELPVVDTKGCREFYRRKKAVVAEGMFCAGGRDGHRDACQGDSGGPMIIDGKLAGITAWGLGCGQKGYPGMYLDVAKYNGWIVKNAKALLAEVPKKGKTTFVFV